MELLDEWESEFAFGVWQLYQDSMLEFIKTQVVVSEFVALAECKSE